MANSIEKIADIWSRYLNPLRNLNTYEIDRLLQNARLGNDVRLQQCFSLIEQTMPIFQVCIEKRIAGILGRSWDIIPYDNSPESIEQCRRVKKIVEMSDMLNEGSFTDAIRTLALGAFKGRAFVKPFIDEKGIHFKTIENWNILRKFNSLWWNPDANESIIFNTEADWANTFQQLPKDEVCYTLYERPIDLPGITIYLRQAVGENKWAQFVERCGIPQVILTAPDGTPESELPKYTQRSIQIMNGGSGVMPSGCTIQELVSGRAQDPFSKFCEHQMEMISILATGGSLNTLGGATGLGSDLAEQQNSQFQSLITQDCKKIQNTLNFCAISKIVKELLKQPEVRCKFEFTEEDNTTAAEYVDLALKLRDLGATIDISKLKSLTNLQFIAEFESNGETQVWQPTKKDAE